MGESVLTRKVLHFIDSGGLYGAESVLLNLSREMCLAGKYTPVIGCIVGSPDEQNDLFDKAGELGLAAEKLVVRNGMFLWDVLRLSRRLKNLGIDLIHSHGYKPSVFGFFVRLLSGIPVTATCHLWFMQGKIPLKMRLMVKLELFLYRYFPVVVAVSQPIKEVLQENGVSKEKLKVIKNGIFFDDYGQLDAGAMHEIRAALGLENGEICLLNIGRLSHQKAQANIVLAAKKMREKYSLLKFFIVGEGPLREVLEKQIADEGLQHCVKLLGFRSDTANLLRIADVFLLPSRDEGMPMALLEAVASKVPVIVTPVGDIPNVIVNKESGVLVPVDDIDALCAGIMQLVNSKVDCDKYCDNAWNAMKREYSSMSMYHAYRNVYDCILGQRI